jgi:hypothetical protein
MDLQKTIRKLKMYDLNMRSGTYTTRRKREGIRENLKTKIIKTQ